MWWTSGCRKRMARATSELLCLRWRGGMQGGIHAQSVPIPTSHGCRLWWTQCAIHFRPQRKMWLRRVSGSCPCWCCYIYRTPFPHMDRFLYLGNLYFLLLKKNINHVNRSLQHTIVGKYADWFRVDGMCKYLDRNNTNLFYYCLFGSMSAYAAAGLLFLGSIRP